MQPCADLYRQGSQLDSVRQGLWSIKAETEAGFQHGRLVSSSRPLVFGQFSSQTTGGHRDMSLIRLQVDPQIVKKASRGHFWFSVCAGGELITPAGVLTLCDTHYDILWKKY